MKRTYCDRCKNEMIRPHSKVLDNQNHQEFELCSNCSAKIFNFLGHKSGSDLVETMQKFEENKDMKEFA